jgi:hypothetical protein
LRAVITGRGTYNGTTAFEYEIREDDGTVLAFDYVHGAVDEDFVLSDYLPNRLQKWLLSATPEQRANRREARLGGVHLGDTANGQLKDRLNLSVSMTVDEAILRANTGRVRA